MQCKAPRQTCAKLYMQNDATRPLESHGLREFMIVTQVETRAETQPRNSKDLLPKRTRLTPPPARRQYLCTRKTCRRNYLALVKSAFKVALNTVPLRKLFIEPSDTVGLLPRFESSIQYPSDDQAKRGNDNRYSYSSSKFAIESGAQRN